MSATCLVTSPQFHKPDFLWVWVGNLLRFNSFPEFLSFCWIPHLLILPQLTGHQIFIDKWCFRTIHKRLIIPTRWFPPPGVFWCLILGTLSIVIDLVFTSAFSLLISKSSEFFRWPALVFLFTLHPLPLQLVFEMVFSKEHAWDGPGPFAHM